MAREHEQAGLGGKVLDDFLREGSALGREQDASRGARVLGLGGEDGVPDRLAHHDHAGAAAEWAVVGFAVLVVGEGADVGGVDGENVGFDGAGGDGDA